ncbi:TetR family transcriptional regulator C-terminal domain-containing protein [Actinoplanes bogorensis]|uniref:TetR family transcriptional regulator C-terminal domain-containing protein n=1 Tax=Paractinoplanes bogorensis TaxID=1610840 RepID=A0ABS5Z481_9ACTN|nr:TetR family transcriptional regulator C-terminal domain-containing protein [Actinoplanes bogorensis]MBU2670468.1 TetR family transcriptional regulator C-terminal domain-containing protein [Actinoplanes bogorensis]
MPKIVDHAVRRQELAAAVGRVIARDGVAEVSIRSVAAESGWSSGSMRHYFATRGELLAFACEQVIDQVTERITAMSPRGDVREAAFLILLETMPVDPPRRAEAEIAFSFLALGLGDPALAAVQKRHFAQMYDLCRQLATQVWPDRDGESAGRRLHAVVDGLTVHVLAGHLTVDEMMRQLEDYLKA